MMVMMVAVCNCCNDTPGRPERSNASSEGDPFKCLVEDDHERQGAKEVVSGNYQSETNDYVDGGVSVLRLGPRVRLMALNLRKE